MQGTLLFDYRFIGLTYTNCYRHTDLQRHIATFKLNTNIKVFLRYFGGTSSASIYCLLDMAIVIIAFVPCIVLDAAVFPSAVQILMCKCGIIK